MLIKMLARWRAISKLIAYVKKVSHTEITTMKLKHMNVIVKDSKDVFCIYSFSSILLKQIQAIGV